MSSVTWKEIADAASWNRYIEQLQPNTFLQNWQWGELQRRSGEGVRFLAAFSGTTQIGAALLLTIRAKRSHFLFCPHGPLAADESTVRHLLLSLVEVAKQFAADDKAVALRISPLLIANQENTVTFQSLHFRPAPLHMHTELTWMLDIQTPEQKLLENMRKTTRHAIKKGNEAGVEAEIISDSSAVDRFWPLYNQTKQRHQFIPFSRLFLKNQLELFSAGNHVYTVIAKHQKRDVAAGIFMHIGSTVFYHHGASVKLPSSVPASHVLQWESIREARRRGATRYNFWGIAPPDKKNHPFAGITIFKTGFGGYALDYMHAQDLPLSWKYWKLWAIESYRKHKRGF